MIKSISHIITKNNIYKALLKQSFSWESQVKEVKLSNMRFQMESFYLSIYPYHPQIEKKKTGSYQIRKNSNVLVFNFVPFAQDMPYQEAWKNRKNFLFRFNDLGKILDLTPGSFKSHSFLNSRKINNDSIYKKELIISDIGKSNQKKIEFIGKKQIQSDNNSKQLSQQAIEFRTQMDYLDYTVLLSLIRSSLGDLYGWNLIMQTQKKQFISGIQKQYNVKQTLNELQIN